MSKLSYNPLHVLFDKTHDTTSWNSLTTFYYCFQCSRLLLTVGFVGEGTPQDNVQSTLTHLTKHLKTPPLPRKPPDVVLESAKL